MKLTPLAKVFVTLVILAVLAFTGYHYGGLDRLKQWSGAKGGSTSGGGSGSTTGGGGTGGAERHLRGHRQTHT